MLALEILYEKAKKPLEWKASFSNTNIRQFQGFPKPLNPSNHALMQILQCPRKFHIPWWCCAFNQDESYKEITLRTGPTHGGMDSLNKSVWCCHYQCRTKIQIVSRLCFLSCTVAVIHGQRMMSRRRVDAFVAKCPRRNMGHRLDDRVKLVATR